LPLNESLIPLGFECDDGWFEIIWELSEKLENEILKLPEHERTYYKAQKVKEKFGELRFYITETNDAIYQLIKEAENKSSHICETCGKGGIIRGRKWVHVSCDECLKK
jgi:hypothetical protein